MIKLHLSQQDIYFDQMLDPKNLQYNIGTYVMISGNLDVKLLKESIISCGNVFDIFKFKGFSNTSPSVYLSDFCPEICVTELDFSGKKWSDENRKEWLRERINQAFDIYNGSLYDLVIIKIKKDVHLFYVGCHHLFSDGYGIPYVFLTYVFDKYHSLRTIKQEFKFPSYVELIKKSESYLGSGAYESDKNHWRERFKSSQEPILMRGSKLGSFQTNSIQLNFSSREQKKLRLFCLKNEISLQDFLIGALTVYYKKAYDVDYFDFSLYTHNRTDRKERQTLGVFSKLIPCRIEAHNQKLNELFRLIKANQRQDYRYKQFPVSHFNKMIREDGNNHSSPFDICVNYRYFKLETKETELHLRGFRNDAYYSKTPIEYSWCDFAEKGNENIYLEIIFREDYFTKPEVVLIGKRLLFIIDQFYDAINEDINTIDIVPASEKKQLLTTFNDTGVAYSREKTLVELFQEQASKKPDQVALVFEDRQLTYRELDNITNQLGSYLHKNYNIKPDDLVSVIQPRNEWMMICILGVLKSSAAYVPIDPNYPQDRIDYILKDTRCKVCLDEKELNNFKASQVNYQNKKLSFGLGSSNLAYVIYTSGSTGHPKGVMIEHKNVINFFAGMSNLFGEQPGTFLSMTNYTFDISVLELLWTLSKGYKVVIQGDVRQIEEQNNAGKSLEFSLFYFGNAQQGNDNYKLLVEGAKYADQNGYKAVWTPERHFHEFGGLYPNPSLTAAVLSGITKNVHIRAGSIVLPLHHPIRVAEDWSVIDNLSAGRAGIACASGWHPDDFVFSPGSYEKRHEVMYQYIDVLRKLWKGENLAFENGKGNLKQTKIYPKPVQQELPLWITSAGNIDTFISAGKLGVNVLTHLLGESVESLNDKIIAYRQAYAQSGHDVKNAKVTLMLHTYIGSDQSDIEKKARQPFINYIKSSAGLIQLLVTELYQKTGIDKLSEEELDALYEHAYNRFVSYASLVGTKETCLKMLKKLSKIGVDEIACLIDFGVDYESTIQSLKKLTVLKDQYNDSGSDYSVYAQIKKHNVTHLQLTPSIAGMLNQHLTKDSSYNSLQAIFLGGERVPLPLVKNLYEKLPRIQIYNMYGPTETTIWSTVSKIKKNAEKIVIGKPIANTIIYIFGQNKRLLPIGVAGEIYIGGDGLARGYTNKELTEQSFIEDPYRPGEHLYRTGDFGCWLSDGTIEFIGRRDDQVKIRGYRIELGEIEHALLKNDQIQQCAVLVRENQNNEKELIAYITAKSEQNTLELRSFLKELLPEYMLPDYYVQLDTMPLNTSGKINKKALPDPQGLGIVSGVEYVAARNQTEEKLVKIWQEVLERENIGVKDNFFMLGGDSLKAVRLVASVKSEFNLKLDIRNLFQNASIELFVKEMERVSWLTHVKEENVSNYNVIEI